jgi:hypothetical protein
LDDHLLSSLGHEEDVGMRGDESGSVMPDKVRVIWGTNIVIQQTIQQFKDFLLHFTPAHLQLSGTSPIEAASRSFNSEDTEEVASKWTPYYPTVLRRLYETQRPYLDLANFIYPIVSISPRNDSFDGRDGYRCFLANSGATIKSC